MPSLLTFPDERYAAWSDCSSALGFLLSCYCVSECGLHLACRKIPPTLRSAHVCLAGIPFLRTQRGEKWMRWGQSWLETGRAAAASKRHFLRPASNWTTERPRFFFSLANKKLLMILAWRLVFGIEPQNPGSPYLKELWWAEG